MGNKIKYGLKNVYYVEVTELNGTVAYGAPKPIPGAVNMSLSAAGENVTFYADDQVYFEENTNNGYEGSIEMALIPDSFRVDILGDTIDTNGALIENANAKPKKFALLHEFDGDVNKTRHVLYSVLPTRPNIDASTKTNTKEPKTETMNISVRPALDTSDVKAKIKQGETGYDTFFTAVYLKNMPINTIAVNTATFSKAAPADISIDATSTYADNKVTNVKLDGMLIPGIYLTAIGPDVTIESGYLATLDNGTYAITIEFERGNAINVILTVVA